MISFLKQGAERLLDGLEERWGSPRTQRMLANILIVVFVGGLIMVEMRRRGWLPEAFHGPVSESHFQAVHVAFTLLLLYEVIALVFGLAKSVARAAGMQFEIMSLILIRQSFKELKGLPEPIDASAVKDVVHFIISDAVGALLIFLVLIVFYRIQRHPPISSDDEERLGFIRSKKVIALLFLVCLPLLAGMLGWSSVATGADFAFFEAFYTALIFADVLIVLMSLRYSTAYPVVFRYFGFAVAAVLVRLALTAPRIWDAALGLAGVLFALGVAWAYNHSLPVEQAREA